ncbi:MAG: fatty acid desaturase family protein [Rhodospirillales bacterium]
MRPEAPYPREAGRPLLGVTLTAVFLTLNGALYFALPFLAQTHGAAAGLLALAIALTTVSYWSVIHESFHNSLHPSRAVNDALGRALCVLFGGAFGFLRFGHLFHHRFNRQTGDQTELYDAETTSLPGAWAFYLLRITIGLYAVEVLGTFLVFLPKRVLRPAVRAIFINNDARAGKSGEQAVRVLVDGGTLGQMRFDSALAIAAMAAAFWLWGAHWGWLAAALLIRGFLISFLDNAFHYGTPLNDPRAARNLRAAPGLGRLMLNFNLHRVHHADPHIPWYALPAAFKTMGESFDGGYARAALRQLRGPRPRPPEAAGTDSPISA